MKKTKSPTYVYLGSITLRKSKEGLWRAKKHGLVLFDNHVLHGQAVGQGDRYELHAGSSFMGAGETIEDAHNEAKGNLVAAIRDRAELLGDLS